MSYFSFHLSLGLRHLRLSLSGGMGKGKHILLLRYAAKEAKACEQRRQFSTAKNYRTALRSFQHFLKTGGAVGAKTAPMAGDLAVADLTTERMNAYAQWLRQQGVSMNTVSCYLRSLRSIYNKVVKEYGLEDTKPFDGLFTGQVKTVKRAASDDDLMRLRALTLDEGSPLALARDLFFFCLYAQGMPFVDAAYLRKEQIKDGMLTYERHKTGQRIVVKMEPCLQAIVDRYADKSADYVFPILTTTNPALAYRQYKSRLRAYNRALHRLECTAGLSESLTSYVVRHTWATLAYDTDVDIAVISSALGHTHSETTRIYIRDINNRRLAEANKKVLDRIKAR